MAMHQGSECAAKSMIKLFKYEDLLIPSKFFHTEGSEDSRLIFPDETKEDLPKGGTQSEASGARAFTGDHVAVSTEKRSAIDIDVAMEAACGDETFLVCNIFHVFIG
jgi:hypothetical protein